MKLISMTNYVLSVVNADRPCDRGKMLDEIGLYAEFLKQPLKLEMFVPCDENGNVLKEPMIQDYKYDDWQRLYAKYKKAKEKVLFEGYVIIKDTRTTFTIYNEHNQEELGFAKNKPSGETIESWLSISFNPPNLTPNATKQIGL